MVIKMKHADLHTHTLYSDGTCPPEQIVRDAAMLGTEALAIADHDTTRGVDEARKAAEAWGLTIVPAAEISTPDYHILAYGMDIRDMRFQEMLEYSRRCQERIVERRIDIIQGMGVPISLEKVKAMFPHSRLGKMNTIMTMMHDPECREYIGSVSSEEVFNLYMRPTSGKARDLPELSPPEVIRVIHATGGIAVLAHPFKDIDDMAELEKLVALGIDGIENQPNYGEKNNPFMAYAKSKGMLVTYGSDFHGAMHPHRPLLKRNGYLVPEFWNPGSNVRLRMVCNRKV